jgi:hypothetical protein
VRVLCGKDGRRDLACREGCLKAVFLGRLVLIYAAYVASRVVAGLILFGTVASERELLTVGVALCAFALLGWQVQWLRARRRARTR